MNRRILAVRKPFVTRSDRDGWPASCAAALQHLTLAAVLLSYPMLIARAAGASVDATITYVGATMLVMGIGAIVQVVGFGRRIGSGLLCFPFPSIIYLPVLLSAAATGGLELVIGLTLFAGVVTVAMAPLIQRIRWLFPTEIAGLVVLLTGVSSGMLGMQLVMDVGGPNVSGSAHEPVVQAACLAAFSLMVMAALNVWGSRALNLSSATIGTFLGSVVAAWTGTFDASGLELSSLTASVPLTLPVWRFDPGLAIPMVVSAIANVLKTSGTVVVLQKEHDPELERPDAANVSASIAADGVTMLLCGLFGAMPLAASSGSAGLASATRMHGAKVAWCYSGLCLMCALVPAVAHFLMALPRPVLGAALVFSAAFILAGGLKTLSSHPLDSRRTLVVGLGLILGLSAASLGPMLQHVPNMLRITLGSSLVLGTSTALLVNLIFRLGVTRRSRLVFSQDMHDPGAAHQQIGEVSRRWGVRDSVVERARFSVTQAVEILRHHSVVVGDIVCHISFDDYDIHVKLKWTGPALRWPGDMPPIETILEHSQGSEMLAGYMLRRIAEKATLESRRDRHVMTLVFEH